jgi:hypothetical protein
MIISKVCRGRPTCTSRETRPIDSSSRPVLASPGEVGIDKDERVDEIGEKEPGWVEAMADETGGDWEDVCEVEAIVAVKRGGIRIR